MTPLDLAIGVFVGNIAALAIGWSLFQFHKHDHRAPFAAYCGGFILVGALAYVALVDQDPVSFIDPEGARASLTEPQR